MTEMKIFQLAGVVICAGIIIYRFLSIAYVERQNAAKKAQDEQDKRKLDSQVPPCEYEWFGGELIRNTGCGQWESTGVIMGNDYPDSDRVSGLITTLLNVHSAQLAHIEKATSNKKKEAGQ